MQKKLEKLFQNTKLNNINFIQLYDILSYNKIKINFI